MADVEFNLQSVFPPGTSIGAYPVSNWLQYQLPPSGAPQGAATVSATTDADGVSLAGLTAGASYYVAGQVGGVWRYALVVAPADADDGGSGGTVQVDPSDIAFEALGAVDRERSALAHRLSYEDAASSLLVEDWADTGGWTVSNAAHFAVSGGRLFSTATATGAPSVTFPFAVADGARARLVTSIRRESRAAAGGEGWALLGLKSGTRLMLVGLDTGWGARYEGTGIGSDSAISDRTAVAFSAEVGVEVVVDEQAISLVIHNADHSWERAVTRPRSALGTIDGVAIYMLDKLASVGISVGPIAWWRSSAPMPSSAGVERRRYSVARTWPTAAAVTAAQPVRVALPPDYDARRPAPVLLSCHGFNLTEQEPVDKNGNYTAMMDAIQDDGWIIASALGHGDQYGASAALADYLDLYRYVRDHYAIGPVVLHGDSMGGFTTTNLLARRTIPGIVGLVATQPGFNLMTEDGGVFLSTSRYGSAVRSAYGIASDWSDLRAKAGPSNPMLMDPAVFRGVPMLFVASDDDDEAPGAVHARPFAARVAGSVRSVEVRTASGEHNDASIHDAAKVLPFLRGLLA